jgi:D-alanine-D-alanine ligase
MHRKIRVGIVFGGRSGEHEVSLRSARSIVEALDRDRYEPVLFGIDRDGRWYLQDVARAMGGASGTPLQLHTDAPRVAIALAPEAPTHSLFCITGEEVGPIDVVFPVLHGTYGEDGTIQGLWEMAGIPYVGSGVLGSAVGMDKDVARRLLRAVGLPVVEGFVLRASEGRSTDDVHQEVCERLGYPCFVKPCNMGSSVGVSKVRDASQLGEAIATAFRYDTRVLVERGHVVREIEVAVLGNDHPEASIAGEIVPTHEFYSYEAKYLDADGAVLKIPAALDDAQMRSVRAMALDAFRALELQGLARVDFFLEKATGRFFVNEVNTLPGFTDISMYPKLWEATGVPYPVLLDRLVALAIERHARRRTLSTRHAPDSR